MLPSGVREFFYRYRVYGQDKTVALGRYGNGRSLADIRREYRKHRDLQDRTGDVKEHLRAEDRQQEIERRRGTLRQPPREADRERLRRELQRPVSR